MAHWLPAYLVYRVTELGNIDVSRFDCWMYGVRSCHAPEAQNLPTLSSDHDITASGGLPARIAASTLSSFSPMPSRTSTVIHGYCSWNMSKTGVTLSASAPANGIHIEIVTGSCEALAPVAMGSGAP